MAPIALRPLKSSRAHTHTHTQNELWDPVSFRNEIIKTEPTIIENGIGLTCFYTFFLRLCVFVRRRSISFQWGSSSDVTEDVLSSAHVQRSSTSNPFWNNIAVVFPRWLICCLFFATVRGTHATIHGIKLSKLRVCVYWIDFWVFFSFFLSFFFLLAFYVAAAAVLIHGRVPWRPGRPTIINFVSFFSFHFSFLGFFFSSSSSPYSKRSPSGRFPERERERERERISVSSRSATTSTRAQIGRVALNWIERVEEKNPMK